jgi:hypothetical protein
LNNRPLIVCLIPRYIVTETRGVGTGEGPGAARPPQVLPSALFPGAKRPFLAYFSRLKDSLFCPKGTFENLNLCYFAENYFHFRKKYGISGNFFSYLGKNAKCREKFFRFEPPPNFYRKKFLDALFYSDSAPQSLAPPTFRSFLRP